MNKRKKVANKKHRKNKNRLKELKKISLKLKKSKPTKKVVDKKDLEQSEGPCSHRDDFVPDKNVLIHGVLGSSICHAAVHARQPLDKHWHEDNVNAHKRAPKMNPSQQVIHHPARCFWEPVIHAAK